MKIAPTPATPASLAARALPAWPPLLAARGPGASSEPHAHHAMHLLVCGAGALRVRSGARGPAVAAAGVLTAPDVPHAVDGSGAADVLLVFIDPESQAGVALRAAFAPGEAVRLVAPGERDALLAPAGVAAEPASLMREGGRAWVARVVELLGRGRTLPPPRDAVHPRVRKALRLLRDAPAGADTSLEAIAGAVGLSPSRFMHAFTESIGLPLRPYLAWLRLQRAAAAIAAGADLSEAAAAAGFADAPHMSRTFRRMLGMPPSALRPRASGRAPAARS